jgi:uncharacterized phage protein (TIGR01671 family)
MREIKFRAWDNDDKVMTQSFSVGSILAEGADSRFLMQYTGIKDKNDKEIYEKDIIVLFKSNERLIVKENLGAFGYEWGGDFIAFASNYHFKWSDNKSEDIEVIGNIYETQI